jgi:hypothetical protein
MKNQAAVSTTITRALARIRNIRELRTYLASEAFVTGVMALDPGRRLQVMVKTGDMMAAFQKRLGPLVKETASKAPKWNEAMIARLRRAHAQYGNDEDVARALGITVSAAERARFRFIGKGTGVTATTQDRAQAA